MRQQENLGVLVPAPERLAMAWTCLPAATTAAQILDPIVLPQSVGYLHPTKKNHISLKENSRIVLLRITAKKLSVAKRVRCPCMPKFLIRREKFPASWRREFRS